VCSHRRHRLYKMLCKYGGILCQSLLLLIGPPPSHLCFPIILLLLRPHQLLFLSLSRTLPTSTNLPSLLQITQPSSKSLLFISRYAILLCCNNFTCLSTSCFPSYLFPLQNHFLRLHSYPLLFTSLLLSMFHFPQPCLFRYLFTPRPTPSPVYNRTNRHTQYCSS